MLLDTVEFFQGFQFGDEGFFVGLGNVGAEFEEYLDELMLAHGSRKTDIHKPM